MKNTEKSNGRLSVIFLAAIMMAFAALSGIVLAQSSPNSKPDSVRGAKVFTDRCIACHGVTGEGDGEMADRLEVPPQAFTDPEYRKTAVPAVMFTMITDGDIAAGMPPFGPENQNGEVVEQDRWNAIAAVYSMATPPDAIERGTAVYTDSCAECHGETGDTIGNADFTAHEYWVERSNENVFNAVKEESIADHTYDLSDDAYWDLVDYLRTFNYTYQAPAAVELPPDHPVAPEEAQTIEAATVSGTVTNGSTDEIVTEGELLLRAYTMTFEETLVLSGTINTDGSYLFELNNVQSDWIFMVGMEYGALSFTGPAEQLDVDAPNVDIPITVYEPTSDTAVVTIEQQHSIVSFISEDRLSVDEIYTVGNTGTTVFVGTEGDIEKGTVHYMLPEGAENVDFQRSFSAMQNSIPAMEDMIQIGEYEWADTFPARPGVSQASIVVHYELPYDGSADLSRVPPYKTTHINLVLPDNGVELQEGEWTFVDSQDMSGMGSFVTYERLNMEAETAVEIVIEGDPDLTAVSSSSEMGSDHPAVDTADKKNSTNLLIGGLALLLIGGGAAYFIISSRKSDDEEYEDADEDEDADNAIEVNALVARLAALDTTFEAGEMDEAAYQAERNTLKDKLKAIW